MGDTKAKREIPSVNNDYDPYAERNLPHPTNDLESLAHITKGILGTGVLALPEGFSYAGGVMAIVYCLMNAFLCTLGVHILVNGFYHVCKAYHIPVVSYADAMRLGVTLGPDKLAKMSNTIGLITNISIIFFQGGVICIYSLFVAVTVKAVTDNILNKDIPLGLYLLVLFVPFLLINSIQNLKYLAPVSYFSLAVTVMVIGVIYYYSLCEELPNFHETRKYTNDIIKLPFFFGTTLYAFSSIAVTVSVENNMKNPGRFYFLYDVGIIFLLSLYLSIGFLAYWRWGDELNSIVLLNFPMEETLARVANYSCALAIFLSLGLNGIVPVKLLMDNYILSKLESPHPILWEYLLRIGFIALGLFLAITIPFIGIIISFLGTITLSFLTMIFPCTLDICWRHQQGYGKFKIHLIIAILLLAYGIFGLITGLYVNFLDLYHKLTEEFEE